MSRLHGEVSRRLFAGLYPRWPIAEVPVGHITNGVHFPSWDSPWADRLWTETCGKDRWRLGAVEAHSEAMAGLDDETLWMQRGRERADLVGYARERLGRQLGQRGADAGVIAAASRVLDPNALTLGFARRFTAYKRPNLLLHDAARLARLLANPERPVQLIVAGKAHPDDARGKAYVREWARFVQQPGIREHAVFLEDYDMALAEQLVQGVDVWINTPRRPWEACGTSGMKVLVNGGLNLSALDGWWAEAYSETVGWALGDGAEHDDEAAWDAADAGQLYALLENEIVPAFYGRDTEGVPREWVARIRASLATLAPRFSGNRMVRDYVEQSYLPAANAYAARNADGGCVAERLRAWEAQLHSAWDHVHVGPHEVARGQDGRVFSVQVYVGELDPEQVAVELYAEATGAHEAERIAMERAAALPGATHGYSYRARVDGERPDHDYTARVVPRHAHAIVPIELPLVRWQT